MKKATQHYYNVCAYLGKNRVMKETLTARNRAQAADIGRAVLTERGFKLSDVSLQVVPLSRRRIKCQLLRPKSSAKAGLTLRA
jgi:hypothetical protein